MLQGDSTLKQRHEMFFKRKEIVERQIVERQIADLQKSLAVIDYKCAYYKKAVDAGTEKHLIGKDKLPYADAFLKKRQ